MMDFAYWRSSKIEHSRSYGIFLREASEQKAQNSALNI
ncbi:hypothetical protein M23134_02528 [Microscilla marina ATCC 23134]|uniref:Uncharacterized protein n=1 Tax=Microscilla marina ATCC 23134 TaxID=313606 RepID=A1ZTU4_MICM2|nr:hypothetical protein M23134_02528 [Microscilla marina ATCC 23134]